MADDSTDERKRADGPALTYFGGRRAGKTAEYIATLEAEVERLRLVVTAWTEAENKARAALTLLGWRFVTEAERKADATLPGHFLACAACGEIPMAMEAGNYDSHGVACGYPTGGTDGD